MFDLGYALVEPQLRVRAETKTLRRHLLLNILEVLGEDFPTPGEEQPTGKSHCYLCPRKEDKKSKTACEVCSCKICVTHRKKIVCTECAE